MWIGLIYAAYAFAYDHFRKVKGFSWNWLSKLTLAAWILMLMGILMTPMSFFEANPEDKPTAIEMGILYVLMLFALPVPLLLGTVTEKILPADMPRFKRWVASWFIYGTCS